MFVCRFACRVHVVADFRVAREVGVDVVGGLAARDVQLARKAEGAHAVDEAEVDGFGVAALFATDGFGRDAEDFGGGRPVDVVATRKGGEQAGVGGEVRHDAQLDLGVVGGEYLPAVFRDEGAADAAAGFAAHRDVLQVGVGGGEAAGAGDGLVVAGVDAPGVRVDEFGQAVGVGGFEFGESAVFEDEARQFGAVAFGEFGQHFFVGARLAFRGFAQDGQAELVVEDFLELFGRAEVEGAAGEGVRRVFEGGELAADFGALCGERCRVDAHAGGFDFVEQFCQRHFEFAVECVELWHGGEFGCEVVFQTQGDVGVFAGVGGRGFERDLVEGELFRAFAGDVFEGGGLVVEVVVGEVVKVVAGGGAVDGVAHQHGVVFDAAQFDAGAGEYVAVVFVVLAAFRRSARFE